MRAPDGVIRPCKFRIPAYLISRSSHVHHYLRTCVDIQEIFSLLAFRYLCLRLFYLFLPVVRMVDISSMSGAVSVLFRAQLGMWKHRRYPPESHTLYKYSRAAEKCLFENNRPPRRNDIPTDRPSGRLAISVGYLGYFVFVAFFRMMVLLHVDYFSGYQRLIEKLNKWTGPQKSYTKPRSAVGPAESALMGDTHLMFPESG